MMAIRTVSRTSHQGQSDATEFKQRGLEAAFTVNMKVFQAKFQGRFQYFHFDLNCGSGINADFGCIGSPIAFVRAAESVGVEDYFAGFCDINSEHLRELHRHNEVGENDRCYRFHGHNASLVEAVPEIILARGENPKYAVGMVLADPNGTDVPLDELEWLSEACPRMDIVINWNSTQFKRDRGAFGEDRPTLEDAMRRVRKDHWLIREPAGVWQWTLVIGRNVHVGDHKALGFYSLESLKGQEIFDRCGFKGGINPNRDHPSQLEFAL